MDCTYQFDTDEGPVTIKGMAAMKAFLVLNGVEAIKGAAAAVRAPSATGNIGAFDPEDADIRRSNRAERSSGDPDRAEAQKVEAALSDKGLVDAAKWMATNAPDKDQRIIATAVAAQLASMEKFGVDLQLKIARVGDRVPAALLKARGHTQYLSAENKTRHKIVVTINGGDVAGKVGVRYQTVLHELVHAATIATIYAGENEQANGTKIGETVDRLYGVHNAIVVELNKRIANYKKGNGDLSRFEIKIGKGLVNAFENPDETIAWALASREAQEWLDTIDYPSAGRTIWQELIDAVRSVLGLSPRINSALDEVLSVGKDLLDAEVSQTARIIRTYSWQTGTQSELDTVVRGQVDTEEPDTLNANRRQKLSTLGQTYDLPATGNIDAARIKLQDDALRMKRVIEAVKAKDGKVGEAQNFYDANTLMPGRIQAAIDDFKENVIRPMIDKAVEYGIDMDELSMYAYAKHAKERNIYIASINPRMPDGGSGMTDAEADAVIDAVAKEGKTAEYEELHQTLMGITSATRQTMLAEGLITPEEFETLEGAYENYIPLRGFENVVEETGVARPGVGRGVNVRGAETVRAMGRKSKAGDLIENVIRDYERVISRVEKNDVGKVLLDFVLSNPDPDLWGVDVEKTKPTFNKAQGTVQFTKSIEKGEDTIGVKVGGQQVYIKLADKELTRALRQAWKDETSGMERTTMFLGGHFNNWMRNVLTRYNPLFAAVNLVRDALWSGTTAALDELGTAGLKEYAKVYGKALMASTRGELGVTGTKNAVFGNQKMDALFTEFRNAGGITGGYYMKSLENIHEDLRNDLLKAGASPATIKEVIKKNLWSQTPLLSKALVAGGMSKSKANQVASYASASGIARSLGFLGSASENATRFALYAASREIGRTPAQSAILAKNGSTNFNKKGEWGGALNNLYLFLNASIQGTAQLFKVLQNKNVQAAMGGVTAMGMMMALYGASAGGSDESGEDYWDLIPSHVKQRNLVIMLEPGDSLGNGIERVGKRGRYLTVPVQYGFNFFPNLGYAIADVYRNSLDPKKGMSATKAGMHMTSTLFGSINPFGGAVDLNDKNSIWLALLPTILDIPYQLSEGLNSFGQVSAPEKSPFDRRPDSERMWVSQQDTVPAKIAKAINELGGGNEAKAGKIGNVDISFAPGTIDTLIRSTTGGLGSFLEQMLTSAGALAEEESTIKVSKIPFLNRFYGEIDESANIRVAGERMREVRAIAEEVKAQQKIGLDPEVTDEETKLLALAGMQESYQKMQSQLRKAEIAIIKDDKMTEPQKKLERQRLTVERDKLATEINREYLRTAK